MRTTKDKTLSDDIRQTLTLVPEDRRVIAENLIKELLFMTKTLDGLRATIEKDGAVALFEQGKQRFMRESPALKAYNTTVQRYNLLYKQLADLLPKSQQNTATDAVMDFIQAAAK